MLLGLLHPGGAYALEFHVDASVGSDTRSPLEAQSAATPWATIGHALDTVPTGANRHTIFVYAGVYAEAAATEYSNVEVRALGDVVIEAPEDEPGLDIRHTDVLVEGIRVVGGTHGFRAADADGLVLRDCVSLEATFNGFHIENTSGVTIENSRAISAGSRGFFLDHTNLAYVRNNLAYANRGWGIDLENTNASDPQPPLSTGNVLAFNTVAFNGSEDGGGVRLKNAVGEIRDSIVAENHGPGVRADTEGVAIHHVLLWGNVAPLVPASYPLGGAILDDAPLFADPDGLDGVLGGSDGWTDDDLLVGSTSPAIDQGSGVPASRDVDGSARSDGAPDVGLADLGYHAGASASSGTPPVEPGAAVYHVNGEDGDDTRSRIEAQGVDTPWATISRALHAGLVHGDTILVAAGTYTEMLETDAEGVTLLTTSGARLVVPPGDVGILVQHADTTIDGFTIDGATNNAEHGVEVVGAAAVTLRDVTIDSPTEVGVKAVDAPGLHLMDVDILDPGLRGVELASSPASALEGLTVVGGQNAVRAEGVDGLRLWQSSFADQRSHALHIIDAAGIVLDTNRIEDAGSRGMYLRRTQSAYLRNNLVVRSDDWGIHIDSNEADTSVGNRLAFNTVARNGLDSPSGGIRLQNAIGEIRDNVVTYNDTRGVKTDTAGSTVHHNLFFGNPIEAESKGSEEPLFWSNVDLAPAFEDEVDFRLQLASPGIDAGSGEVESLDISGSTVASGAADEGQADLGFHEDAEPAIGPPPTAPPEPRDGAVFYVDCGTGSDAHTRIQARDPATPWRTLRFAASQLLFGEIVEVADGVCPDAREVGIDTPGVVLRAKNSRGTEVVAIEANAFNIQAPDVTLEGFVIRTDDRAIVADDPEGESVLEGVVVRDVAVVPLTATPPSTDKITIRDSLAPIIENSEIEGGVRGILLRRTRGAYVRNNRVSGASDWGIQVDDRNGVGDAVDNLIAFNTVTGNGDTGADGGIRFEDAIGEVRDSVIASNSGIGVKTNRAPVLVHHSLLFDQPSSFDWVVGEEIAEWDNVRADPLFVGAGQSLSEVAAGQLVDSPALNAGSGPVVSVGISGSTRVDGEPDAGLANLGFHRGADPALFIPPLQQEPGGDGPYTYYVDGAIGNDALSKWDARDPTSPWKTIGRALLAGAAAASDTVVVAPGTYEEAVRTWSAGVHLVAGGQVVIEAPVGEIGLRVDHPGVVVEGLTILGGLHGVRATDADGFVARDCRVSGASDTGFRIVQSADVTIENNHVDGTTGDGILVENAERSYVRNNLVRNIGRWAIHVDAADATTTHGHVIAFNTVDAPAQGDVAGGIRLENATGEIRDNVVSAGASRAIKVDRQPSYIHHNVLDTTGLEIETESNQPPVVWANLNASPGFVDAAAGDFSLAHTASGQAFDSVALDAGSGPVDEADISGTTRTDGLADTGRADPGFHRNAEPSSGRPVIATGPTPEPRSYFVDGANGDDARSAAQAQSAETAWATIDYALRNAEAGDRVIVAPGLYEEAVEIDRDDVTIEGEGEMGSVVLRPGVGQVGVGVENQTGVTVRNITIEGGSQGVRAEGATALRLDSVVAIGQQTLGLHIVESLGPWIDGCIVTGAGVHGVSIERSRDAYVRNNLIYANVQWGIDFDNTTVPDPQPALSTGNVLAFNTVHANGDGIRVLNGSAEVRDNQITAQADLGLFLSGASLFAHHNNFSRNGRDRDRDSASPDVFLWSNHGSNARYVDPAGPDGLLGGVHWQDDDFRLIIDVEDPSRSSRSIDAGSDEVARLDIGGSATSDDEADVGVADLGFHYGAPPAVGAPPWATPPGPPTYTYFVSPTMGDDGRSEEEARDSATPWATLTVALQRANDGDTVVALPGVYPESVEIERAGLTLQSLSPGAAAVHPIAGAGIVVSAPSVTVDGFVIRNATTGITVTAGSNDVRITNCAAIDSATDGFRAARVSRLTVENSITTGATLSGIELRRVHRAVIRNNLSYANGEWGLSHDNLPADEEPVSDGNLVAGNTFAKNGLGNARLANATGLVRDNLFSEALGVGLRLDTDGVFLVHNGFHGNGVPLDPETYVFCSGCAGNRTVNPRFVNPDGVDGILGGSAWADDDFRLSQLAAGQEVDSEALDAGSGSASSLGVYGSTSTAGTIDAAQVDLGFHYDSSLSALPAPSYTDAPLEVLYVDAVAGDDGRSREQASSPDTPWLTLGRALEEARPGDVVALGPGDYHESVRVDVSELTIRGAGVGATVLRPEGRDALRVRAADVDIRNLTIDGARRGVVARAGSDRLRLADLEVVYSDRDGLVLDEGSDKVISHVRVRSSGRYGIYVRRSEAFLIDDVVLDGNARAGVGLVRSSGVVRFATIHGGRDGFRTSRSSVSLVDSILAGFARIGLVARGAESVSIAHTLLGTGGRLDLSADGAQLGSGLLRGVDPGFVAEGAGDLRLRADSPAIDAGSGLAEDLGVSGSATGIGPDVGVADLGAHLW